MLEAIFLGVVTWLSMLLSAAKLPKWVRALMIRHPVATDVAATGLGFLLLTSISKSLVAASAAAVAGLLVNFTLFFIVRKKDNDN